MSPKRNRQAQMLSLIFFVLSIICACGSGTTLRIKTDKEGREMAKRAMPDEEKGLFMMPSMEAAETTRAEPDSLMAAVEINLLKIAENTMGLMIKAQELKQSLQLNEAEKQLVQALSQFESRSLYKLLGEIYELQGDFVKSDSCRRKANELEGNKKP